MRSAFFVFGLRFHPEFCQFWGLVSYTCSAYWHLLTILSHDLLCYFSLKHQPHLVHNEAIACFRLFLYELSNQRKKDIYGPHVDESPCAPGDMQPMTPSNAMDGRNICWSMVNGATTTTTPTTTTTRRTTTTIITVIPSSESLWTVILYIYTMGYNHIYR